MLSFYTDGLEPSIGCFIDEQMARNNKNILLADVKDFTCLFIAFSGTNLQLHFFCHIWVNLEIGLLVYEITAEKDINCLERGGSEVIFWYGNI